ncbi:MAG: hypothetical protein WC050_02775 [Candidatus Paceibacterota bacterium]
MTLEEYIRQQEEKVKDTYQDAKKGAKKAWEKTKDSAQMLKEDVME